MDSAITKIVTYISIGVLLVIGLWSGWRYSMQKVLEPQDIELGATTYYVSNYGDDSNDGLASSTAWATISKVEAQSFAAGDIIQFRCGDIWRENLIMPASGSAGNRITLTNYGNCTYPDNLPILTGSYDYGSNTADWIDTDNNIWTTATNTFATMGHIFTWDGSATSSISAFVQEGANEAALSSQGDWWHDTTNDLLKIYSTSNPATFYDYLEVTTDAIGGIIRGNNQSYVTVDGIAVMFSNQHAFDMGYPSGGASFWTIQNSWAAWCGSDERGGGNCIQITGNLHDFIVDNNSVWGCFDSGVSPQNFNPGNDVYNITISNNDIYDCATPVEFLNYTPQGGDYDNTIIRDVTVENNTLDCARNGDPWALQFNQVGDNGIQSLVWQRGTTTNVRVIGNEIKNCVATSESNGHGIRILTNAGSSYSTDSSNWTIEGNLIHDNQNDGISFEANSFGSEYNTTSAVLINNFIYNNGTSDREVEIVTGDWEGIRMYNNTIVDTTGDTGQLVDGQAGATMYMYNNILQGNRSANATTSGTIIESNNIRYSTSGAFTTLIGYPSFVNATSANGALDFDIQTGSAALDAGLNSQHPTSTDYYGNSVFNTTWDIGAMEFQGAAAAAVEAVKRIFNGGLRFLGGVTIN